MCSECLWVWWARSPVHDAKRTRRLGNLLLFLWSLSLNPVCTQKCVSTYYQFNGSQTWAHDRRSFDVIMVRTCVIPCIRHYILGRILWLCHSKSFRRSFQITNCTIMALACARLLLFLEALRKCDICVSGRSDDDDDKIHSNAVIYTSLLSYVSELFGKALGSWRACICYPHRKYVTLIESAIELEHTHTQSSGKSEWRGGSLI